MGMTVEDALRNAGTLKVKKTKLIINGHAQHGKDYLAAAVAERLGMRRLNASMWWAEKVLMPAFPGMYSCVEEAYLDRVNKRKLWFGMMREGNWQQEFMEHSDIYCGHRDIEEHQEMQSSGDYLSVWVHWNGKKPESPSSTEWVDRTLITNNHDLMLYHSGEGVGEMVYTIEDALNG